VSLTVSAKSAGNFEIHPEGVVAARCTRIIDLGTQSSEWQGKPKKTHKILVQWESESLMGEGEHAGKPFLISQRYTASLSDKAQLRKDMEAWRGRKFTPAELERFDLKNVLGKPCMINVVHNENGGKTYANIASIMPLPASMTAPKAVGDLVFFSFEAFDQRIFDGLSDGIKEVIQKAAEWQATQGASYAKEQGGQGSFSDDDEIPF
jgi:hypothetical protein